MTIPYITAEMVEDRLDWLALTDALIAGHKMPKADVGDVLNQRGTDAMLTRAAWIDGLGMAVKSMSVFPGDTPSIKGAMLLFNDQNGAVEAVIDGILATKWKTAGDSLLGARLLARPDSKRLLIVGAGTVARSLIQAYRALFPNIDITVWNRTPARAEALGEGVAEDLEAAIAEADIVCGATMSIEPIIRGEWLQPGQHIDLIGAYRPDMREVDDTALLRSEVFVDSRATTLGHIGELKIPLDAGIITEDHVKGDLYQLTAGSVGRSGPEAITLFKNGGGAHLDLMTGRMILSAWQGAAT